MIASQIGIALCGVTAVFLSQDARASRRRWSSVFGLAGQPFWIVETFTHQQWGILALTALYAYSWGRGFWTHWIAPRRAAA
jgi:hypothetical protein